MYDLATGSGTFQGAIATKKGIKFIKRKGDNDVEIKIGMGSKNTMLSCTFFEDGERLAAGSI